jgi:hypothetical protein
MLTARDSIEGFRINIQLTVGKILTILIESRDLCCAVFSGLLDSQKLHGDTFGRNWGQESLQSVVQTQQQVIALQRILKSATSSDQQIAKCLNKHMIQ